VTAVTLRPLEAGDVDVAASWLSLEENYKWLDFGGGQQSLSAASLAFMRLRDLHELLVFTVGEGPEPCGIVALSNVARPFGTASLWYVLGKKEHAGHGCTTRAVGQLLEMAFGALGLQAVNAWAVDGNVPSLRVLERNGFRLVGRQRRCHRVEGRLRDRLLFDLLAEERPG